MTRRERLLGAALFIVTQPGLWIGVGFSMAAQIGRAVEMEDMTLGLWAGVAALGCAFMSMVSIELGKRRAVMRMWCEFRDGLRRLVDDEERR